ncbi:MAG: hypothetical protein GC146_16810 [Limimaricola sp.]|uniref:hypothetical protein n=1 Tax=Limimaricola sp. TaxID=2211665 RepID=UPI001D779B46|nr:hypothetical protein [Limimaricola sp.]MBI1418880.1 hypothetical protein [Limimaricola sp.]
MTPPLFLLGAAEDLTTCAESGAGNIPILDCALAGVLAAGITGAVNGRQRHEIIVTGCLHECDHPVVC